MKYIILVLMICIFAEAQALEWSFKTYAAPEKRSETDWRPATSSRKLIDRTFEGYIEYRTNFSAPDTNLETGIYLGQIGDADKVYVNGVLIGQTGGFPPQYQFAMDTERQYFIPPNILHLDQPNELKVVTYSRYFVNKGLNLDHVKIAENTVLQGLKYKNELINNFSRIIVPLLCIVLAFIAFPAFAPRSMWCEQTVITLIGISSFILGMCRGRICFHYFDMLLTYKMTIISSIATLWLISIHTIRFNVKRDRVIGGILTLIALGFSTKLILQETLLDSAPIAKAWFHVAPIFILVSIIYLFRYRPHDLFLKAGIIILFITDVNDILHDLRIINSVSMLQTGLGIFTMFLILNQIVRLRNSWEKFFTKELEFESDVKVGRQAAQLAHDIRSPLEALKSARDEIDKLPELERTSINLAIGRIEEIAYNLLVMRKATPRLKLGHTHIQSTLGQIIQEKKLQFRNYPNLTIDYTSDKDSFSSFSEMESETFKRVISNLVTNAVEASNYRGIVEVKLLVGKEFLKVQIEDNGPSIPPQLFKSLFEKGFTTKVEGNGLGLYHAKKEIESINGTITFTQADKTRIEVSLPVIEPPKTFATNIDLTGITNIIILDDDESIHQVWKKRFKGKPVVLEHFFKASELLRVYKKIPDRYFLLSDYELLGEKQNGIDCIRLLEAQHKSILVTARADEAQIITECEKFSVKVLPKSMARDIEINNESKIQKAVLIDDDKLTHLSWKIAAKKSNVDLLSYCSVDDFLREAHSFGRHTPIYVDSNLGENLKGEVLSEEIYKLGFTELFMATGYSSLSTPKPHWIKSVLGKKPPWHVC